MATRISAVTRRRHATDAGLRAFADDGLTSAAVHRVAREIGVSSPYVFRLFGSTHGLFMACLDEVGSRIVDAFSSATATGGDSFDSMGAAFRTLMADGVIPGMWLQACAIARTDDVVAARCRDILSRALHASRQHSTADTEALTAFLARGSLVVLLQPLGIDLTDGLEHAIDGLLTVGAER